jgi:hypothetical protein
VSQCRSFTYKLNPTKGQVARLTRGSWTVEHRTVSYLDQAKQLKDPRDDRPEVLAMGVTVCRGTLKRLDRAYAAIFRRCRAGDTRVPPRHVPSPLRLTLLGGPQRLVSQD